VSCGVRRIGHLISRITALRLRYTEHCTERLIESAALHLAPVAGECELLFLANVPYDFTGRTEQGHHTTSGNAVQECVMPRTASSLLPS
jgi:hypothetical protein